MAESKRTICMPVDGSPYSLKAVQWANENILRDTDLVVLLHVVSGLIQPSTRITDKVIAWEEVKEKTLLKVQDLLKDLGTSLTKPKFVEYAVLEGDPREELLNGINGFNADMVIVGSRGLGGIKQILLGSVSTYLIKHLAMPVLVVR